MNDRAYPYRKGFSLIIKISQFEAGKLYIVEDYHWSHAEPVRSLIRVLRVGFQGRCDILDYEYVNPRDITQNRPHTNPGPYAMWDFYIKQHPKDPSLSASMLIWEAWGPIAVCPHCGSAEFDIISAYNKHYYYHGYERRYQRVGSSTNYNRCRDCSRVYRDNQRASIRGNFPYETLPKPSPK